MRSRGAQEERRHSCYPDGIMRTLCFAALYLLVGAPGFAQTAGDTGPGLPKDPRAIFEAAAPLYDFNSPELKPWHLKATYQLYDEKGKPLEQGTYEYWWASPKVYRSTWTRAGVSVSDWHTAEGTNMRKANGNPLRYFERALNTILLSPLPSYTALDFNKMKLDLKMVPSGSGQLARVIVLRQWEQNGRLLTQSSDTADRYFFDPSTMALLLSYSNAVTKEFSQIVKMQGRHLPRSIAISAGKQKIFTVSVEAIDGISPDDAALVPAADAVLERLTVDHLSARQSGDDVTKGELVTKTPPVYPLVAKSMHQQGTVVLGAVIGTDGRIHDLEVLASPSPLLSDSAKDAVKRWVYKPYLLDGAAVEVETTVNVIYSLSQ